MRGPWRRFRSQISKSLGARPSSLASIGLAAAVAAAYFLAARVSLLLLTEPDGVAVFWPAAGVAAGTLIAQRRQARIAVSVAVIAATIAAHATGDRLLSVAIVFAPCNAAEALLAAWVIERYVGRDFGLDNLRHVLWLLAAAIIASAATGTVAALGDNSATSIVDTWWHWSSSDAIGIITTAPLIIGAASILRAPPHRREVVEGAAALIAVAFVMATIIFVLPQDWWDRIVPVELLFPVLLWIAARCRPAVTSAAVFIVSLTIVAAFIFRLGHFGDVGPSMEQRAFASQAAVLGVAVFAYILAALFAERRRHAADMEESANRMQAIVNTVVDGIIIIDEQGTVEDLNPAAALAFGYGRGEVVGGNVTMLMPDLNRAPQQASLADCLQTAKADAMGAERREVTGVRKDGSKFPIEFAVNEMGVAGRRRFTIVARDITARKLAEEHQKTLTRELQHRTNNLLTVVQIIANRTLSGDDPPKEKERLGARLQALARANKQLTESDFNGLTLGEIIQSELEPYLERCRIEGAEIVLDHQCAQNFSLVLHELATNAIKYGALSNLQGRINITWGTRGDGRNSQLTFQWREQEGPPVVAPKRQGFGSTLLRATFANARANFHANGFCCEIEVPLREAAPRTSEFKPAGDLALGMR